MGIRLTQQRGEELLRQMLGPQARFRPGQWDAIRSVVEERSRALIVQRTGWGKSLVYFIATKLLREQGAGPSLLISPLLSLMRNQVAMAERIDVRALTMNSGNSQDWTSIEQKLSMDQCDILLISPERLANQRFVATTLALMQSSIGLFVVDEAHCISDWGHDFRPDYRRIVRLVQSLPRGVPVLATTATANDRVIEDVAQQLGPELKIQRGALARASLRLQAIRLADQSERLAWLAQHVPTLPGSGVIYCLTVADCERVSGFLQLNGIDAPAYHADSPDRPGLEERLLGNDLKALVATVALGMGFDKPDLGFVIHYQRPGSVVAYYQQIGRAGRSVERAYAVLLSGSEDDEIHDYFINSAFPPAGDMLAVLQAIEESKEGLTTNQLRQKVNMSTSRIERCIKLLEVDSAVVSEGRRYLRTVNPWQPDEARSAAITERRRRELQRMREFVDSTTCLMEFIARELDDPDAAPCGRCAICQRRGFPGTADPELVQNAVAFLRRDSRTIEARKQWAADPVTGRVLKIKPDVRVEEGRALAIYGDAGWGRAVRAGKYQEERFNDDLALASATMIRERWKPQPPPEWVAAIPSLRHPLLVPDFAKRLASSLGLPYREALGKVRETREQKLMANSPQQLANIQGAFQVLGDAVLPGPVLLVDDVVDSRWTLTVCGALLKQAGANVVYPFALATNSRVVDDG